VLLHRALRDAHALGDVALREAFQAAQQERLAALAGRSAIRPATRRNSSRDVAWRSGEISSGGAAMSPLRPTASIRTIRTRRRWRMITERAVWNA